MKKLFEKYIKNKSTAEEQHAVDKFIRKDRTFHTWFMQSIASAEGVMPNKQQLLDSIHQSIDYHPPKKRTQSYKKWMQYAAIGLFFVALGVAQWFFIQHIQQVAPNEVTVLAARGQKAEITLPDGTHVNLNSDTKIIYSTDFNVKNREIQLHGEAFFSVAKNQHLPFIVHTDMLNVKAVGTQFNIKAYRREAFVTTTLFEGRVRVDVAGQTVDLEPNEQLELNKTTRKLTKRNLQHQPQEADWMSDKIEFRKNTFEEVAATLSRIYNVEIILKDESLKAERFSGIINNNSLESTLKILTLTSPFNYTFQNDTVTIFHR